MLWLYFPHSIQPNDARPALLTEQFLGIVSMTQVRWVQLNQKTYNFTILKLMPEKICSN